MASIDGIVTGLDTTSIIQQLIAAERIPQNQLLFQQATAEARAAAFADLRGRYDAVRSAAEALELHDDWSPLAATSSNELVKASANTGDFTGEVRFTVIQRARAHSIYSNDILTSLDDVVSTGGGFTASGYEPLGFSGLTASGLAEGPQTFEVTRESTAARKIGTTALPAGGSINGSRDGLDLTVNGVAGSIDIANGSYATRQDLVDAVNAAIDAVPAFSGEVTAVLGAADEIELVTTREGSEATIQVTGGDAATYLGLTIDPLANTGVDGIVTVNGIDTFVSNTDAGTQVVLDAGTGTITATISGGLRAGSASVDMQPTGSQTLEEVVEWINSNDLLTTKAAIIQVDEGQYRLQLTAGETGDDSAIDLDLGILDGLVGGFTTLSTGQDAELRVEGDTPFTIRSSTDTFTDIMPGLDVTLAGVPTEEVVVNLSRDTAVLGDRVQALVDAVNHVVGGLKEASSYDADAEEASLLTGNSTVRRALDEITSALIGPVAGAGLGSVGLTGLTIQNDGTFEFDRATFDAAYEADPEAVERVYSVAFDSEDDSAMKRLLAEVDDATLFGVGYLSTAEEAEKARVEDLQDSIDAWDRRLEIREASLRATYVRLESALAELQSQGTWLAGQLATLATPTSGS